MIYHFNELLLLKRKLSDKILMLLVQAIFSHLFPKSIFNIDLKILISKLLFTTSFCYRFAIFQLDAKNSMLLWKWCDLNKSVVRDNLNMFGKTPTSTHSIYFSVVLLLSSLLKLIMRLFFRFFFLENTKENASIDWKLQ